MNALSVLFLTTLSDLSGDAAWLRVVEPARQLAERADIAAVHVTSHLDPNLDALMEAADVVVIQDLADPDLFPRVTAARERGCVVVFDLSHDVTSLPLLHPLQSFWVEEQSQRNAFKLASLATLFTASNIRLLAQWATVNPRGNLVADSWPHEVEWQREERSPEVPFRVAMVVELHEYEGAREVIESILAWLQAVPAAILEVLAPEIVHSAFSGGPEGRVVLSSAREHFERVAAFGRADVVVLTLEATPYALRQGDRHWLEAAACGAVVLAPKRGPYEERITHGANGVLYTEADEVIAALDRLSTDSAFLHHIRAAAGNQIAAERQLKASLDEQVSYWRLFLKRERTGATPTLPARLPGPMLPHEHAMYEGIISFGPLSDREAARSHFLRAAELIPGSPEPFMMLARVVPNPIEYISQALERAPRSLRANLLLGDALQDATMNQEALAAYMRTAEIFPAWELPYLRVALLLAGLGLQTDSDHFVRMAADVATFLEEGIETRP